jgi:hypothetical protein
VRHSDAFQPGGDYRGVALRSGSGQVLDPGRVQRMQCPEEKNQSYARAYRAEGKLSMARERDGGHRAVRGSAALRPYRGPLCGSAPATGNTPLLMK